MTRRRIYSPRDRADALRVLANSNGSTHKAASALGIPRRTLRRWQGDSSRIVASVPQDAKPEEGGIVDVAIKGWRELRDLSRDEALKALRAGKVLGRDAAWITAVSQDKLNILEGRPDSRTEIAGDFASWLIHQRKANTPAASDARTPTPRPVARELVN